MDFVVDVKSPLDRGESMTSSSDVDFVQFLDLGLQPISNAFPVEPFSPPSYRLSVGFEQQSGLVRLVEQPPASAMFHSEYAFETRTSKKMIQHFDQAAETLLAQCSVSGRHPRVLEVGSNDGAFLQSCKNQGAVVLGVDPSTGVNAIARRHGVEVWEAFFSMSEAKLIRERHGEFDLAYAANALCHIPDFEGNLRAFNEILTDQGLLVFEDPYLGSVLSKTTYDQFYDEHYYMFAANSVKRVANKVGLTLFDVEQIPTHGGSMRYFLARSPRPETKRLLKALRWEAAIGLEDLGALSAFAANVQTSAHFLQEQLSILRRTGLPVIGLGAASKTVTVLNYAGITSDLIRCFADSTASKEGRYMAGTDIQVTSQSTFSPSGDFVAFLGAHNHETEILGSLKVKGIVPEFILSSIPFSTVRI
jgi:methylation protein EvaC